MDATSFDGELKDATWFDSGFKDAIFFDGELEKLPTSFILGSVCRGWRRLAWSTPELWSTLSFSLGKPTKPKALSRLQAVTDWLQLSGGLPLTLCVFKYWRCSLLSQEECGAFIDLLNQHSGRWHKLFLRLPAPLFARFCGTSTPSSLCDLLLISDRYTHNDQSVLPYFKMHSRPSPIHLTIAGLSSPLSGFDIGWENLTSIKMILTTCDECIKLIRQAPLLEFCMIELFSTESFSSIPKTTVKHMHLRVLKLGALSSELLGSFLDALELPALEAYGHCQSKGSDFAVDNVISLLKRSRIYLKQLELGIHPSHVNSPAEDITRLLNAVPCVQNLCLQVLCSCNEFSFHELFENLSSSPPILEDGPRFLPDLRSLTISGYEISVWPSIPRLFSFPRWKLLRLEVNELEGIMIDTDTLRKVLCLVDEGINFQVSGGRGRVDYLPALKESLRREGPSEEPELVDHTLESELVTTEEDQEGYTILQAIRTKEDDQRGDLTVEVLSSERNEDDDDEVRNQEVYISANDHGGESTVDDDHFSADDQGGNSTVDNDQRGESTVVNDQRGDLAVDDDQEDLSDERNEDEGDEDRKGCLTSCLNFISRLFNCRR